MQEDYYRRAIPLINGQPGGGENEEDGDDKPE